MGIAPITPPVVLTPTTARLDVIPAQVIISLSSLYPDNERNHVATEYEIWRTSPTGTLTVRAWSAYSDDGDTRTSITLDAGTFSAANTTLAPWTDYAVRARYRGQYVNSNANTHALTCSSWSEWSELRRFRTDDGSSYLFDSDAIRDLYIDIPPESWTAIDEQARPPGCVPFKRDYQRGTVTFEGQTFDNVGIRSKGGCGSARHLDSKTAFKIHLSWDDPDVPECPETRRLHGMKRLTLNNMVQDRTFMHEVLGYSLYARLGVPAPRVNYMRVHVNGDLWGLYLLVESIDRRFLERRFESEKGDLYEGTYWCDLIPENIPPDLEGIYCFSRKFGTGQCSDPSDFDALVELINAIDAIPDGEFFEHASAFLEIDEFLTMWATDAQMGHWDGHTFDIINNYRVYMDPASRKWSVIPTGIDQTFRRDVDPFAVSSIMAQKCIQDIRCAQAFVDALIAANEAFQQSDFLTVIDALQPRIRDDVMADPRKEFGFNAHENQLGNLRSWVSQRPSQMQAYIDAASAALRSGRLPSWSKITQQQ